MVLAPQFIKPRAWGNMKHIMFAGRILGRGLMSGCAHGVPPYQESMENVRRLERSGSAEVKLGEFSGDVARK